jgi:hypothetical protein
MYRFGPVHLLKKIYTGGMPACTILVTTIRSWEDGLGPKPFTPEDNVVVVKRYRNS